MRTKVLKTMLAICMVALLLPAAVSAKTVKKYVEISSKTFDNATPGKWEEMHASTTEYTKKGVIKKRTEIVVNRACGVGDSVKSEARTVTNYKNGRMIKAVTYFEGKKGQITTYKYSKKGVLKKATTVDTKGNKILA